MVDSQLTGSQHAISGYKPRIMLVGDYSWPWYHEACAVALEQIGCEVIRFSWFGDFRHWRQGHSEPFYHSLWHRVQYRVHSGPSVWAIYWRLLVTARKKRPEVVWFYNVRLIAPWVIKRLKNILPKSIFVQYANDNPFSTDAKPLLWRNYLNSISLFDVHFAYRLSNIADYQRHNVKSVHLLRAYFIPKEDYPVRPDEIPERFKCDVVFAGHYEDDGRVEILEAICEAGYNLNLFGGGWNAALSKLRSDSPLLNKYPVNPAIGINYRYAICGAKVALCILSGLNNDTYTRRNFQIPAMKVAMLSQYTDDLADLYESDKEIVFFRNSQECLRKLSLLLINSSWRQSIAKAGYNKVYFAGHDITNRMKSFMVTVSQQQCVG